MIRIVIDRLASNGQIRSFQVKGHAGHADPGFDIVCAGVSAITVGTVNSAEALLGIVMEHEMKQGFLQAAVPQPLDDIRSEKLQLLLESMIVMLSSIEEMYGQHITIQQGLKKRR